MRFAYAVLCIALVAPLRADEATAKKDLEQMQGTWKVVKFEREGKLVPEERIKDLRAVIEGDKFSFVDGKKRAETSTLTLDPSTKPASADLQTTGGQAKITRAIYKIEKDTMTICFMLDGKPERPKDFAPNKLTSTIILERLKK